MIFQNPNFKIQISKKDKGFTLVELMVVISIIAILITAGVSSFSTAQRKSRDAKRKADLRELKTSLEQYFSVCGNVYPTPAGDHFDAVICESPTLQNIMSNSPTDPRSGNNYICPDPVLDNCNGNSFTVCAELESESPSTLCVSSSQ